MKIIDIFGKQALIAICILSAFFGFGISWFSDIPTEDIPTEDIASDISFFVLTCSFTFLCLFSLSLAIISYFKKVIFKEKPDNEPKGPVSYSSSGFSVFDIDLISTHEAGHLMVYAMLGAIPDNFEVSIGTIKGSRTRSYGRCKGVLCKDLLPSMAYFEWKMILLLAGGYAANRYLKKDNMGSSSDLMSWQENADIWLSNRFDIDYIQDVQNNLSLDHNINIQSGIKKDQLNFLADYFSKNEFVFHEIRKLLKEKLILNAEDLRPLWSKIIIPDGAPKPLGEFECFSSTWDNDRYYCDD